MPTPITLLAVSMTLEELASLRLVNARSDSQLVLAVCKPAPTVGTQSASKCPANGSLGKVRRRAQLFHGMREAARRVVAGSSGIDGAQLGFAELGSN
mmetsp:Transcript_26241/g.75274  ORF Transcript_26241/g.75274 Transcript_26241/m.75274 type:complete len:97 (+) Transcript_26241:495-785(+)